jgi:uncharacterized C2H2 Zn-finger protein
MTHGYERQHRIASYNKGCRCETCTEANRKARAHHRKAERLRDPANTVKCSWCGDMFKAEKNMKQHRTRIHGWI